MKSERKAPASAFVSVASACNDTLIEAKLEFFVAVAKPLQEFLLKFQSKASMTPFLTFVFERFVFGDHGLLFKKISFYKKTDTFKKLSAIDPADKKKLKTQSMLTLALLLEVF